MSDQTEEPFLTILLAIAAIALGTWLGEHWSATTEEEIGKQWEPIVIKSRPDGTSEACMPRKEGLE
jgi:hypothetical protein